MKKPLLKLRGITAVDRSH